tara:strand:+ start:6588 stop:6974 length:387 start_codon:yes stop_codon:yes gene_type:complete
MENLNYFLNEGNTSDGQFLLDNGFELNTKSKGGGGRTIAGASSRSLKEDNYTHPKVPGYSIQIMTHWKWNGFIILDDNNDVYYINKRSSGSETAPQTTRKALESTVKLMTKGKLPKSNPKAIEKYYNS